jgi:hypothetical protein
VKRAVTAAGIDASVFSGRSLRACFVTSALDAGVDALKIMPITRHVKVDTLKATIGGRTISTLTPAECFCSQSGLLNAINADYGDAA